MSVVDVVMVVAVASTSNPFGVEPAPDAALIVITAPTATAVYSGVDV
jgi:hypothetical protein